MLNRRRQLLAERGGVLGVQVDLIIRAVESEPDGLLCRAAGQIVFEYDAYFWAIAAFPDIQWLPAPYRGQCPATLSNAADQAGNRRSSSVRRASPRASATRAAA